MDELRTILADVDEVRANPADGLDAWADQVWAGLDWLTNHAEAIETALRLSDVIQRSQANRYCGGLYWYANDQFPSVDIFMDYAPSPIGVVLSSGLTLLKALRELDPQRLEARAWRGKTNDGRTGRMADDTGRSTRATGQ